MKRLWIALAAIFVVVSGLLIWRAVTSNPDTLKPDIDVNVQLQWFDQAQFAGFYVALQKGYYKQEKLNVALTPGSYSTNPILQVASGRAQFGIATGDQVLIQHAQRNDLRAIGTVYTRSVACFMSKKEGNILSPRDLVGKKVGVYRNADTENLLLAILDKHGISRDKVDIVDAGQLAAFLKGELDVFPSYAFNEPLRMKQENIAINLLNPDDFGIRSYSDTIFTTEDYLTKNRDVAIRFIRATQDGWAYAEKNPDEALEIMFQVATNMNKDGGDRIHQQQMLQVCLSRIRDSKEMKLLQMDKTRWSDMEIWLRSIGRVNTTGNADTLCDYQIAEGK